MLTTTAVEPGRTIGVLVADATTHNRERQMVMEGEHRYLQCRKP